MGRPLPEEEAADKTVAPQAASLPAAVDGPGGVKAAAAGDGEPKAEGRRRGGRRSHKEGKEAKDRLVQEPESASGPAFTMPVPVPADETAAVVVAEADPAKSRRGGGRPRRVEVEPDSPEGDAAAAVLAEPGAPDVAKTPTVKRIARASPEPKAESRQRVDAGRGSQIASSSLVRRELR